MEWKDWKNWVIGILAILVFLLFFAWPSGDFEELNKTYTDLKKNYTELKAKYQEAISPPEPFTAGEKDLVLSDLKWGEECDLFGDIFGRSFYGNITNKGDRSYEIIRIFLFGYDKNGDYRDHSYETIENLAPNEKMSFEITFTTCENVNSSKIMVIA